MWSSTVHTTEEALTARLMESTVHALEIYGIYLGKELGLYATLHARGPLSAPQLAEAAGIAPRYAREWLEQQAVAGFLVVDDPSLPDNQRRYLLPPEHATVLVIDDHPAHLAPLAQMVAGVGGTIERVVAAYRTGEGVPYESYGSAFRRGQAGINRPAFLTDLASRWIPAAPDLYDRLRSSPTRVADLGCGAGWSSIAVARACPRAVVIGFDADHASVEDARALAEAEGVAVRFEQRDASAIAGDGPFDLVLILEALHDMSRPGEALAAAREALAPDGSVLIADEKVGDHFHAPADETERMMYGWSIVHCLPVSLTDTPSAAIGTVIRADTVRALATSAGFSRVEILPVDGGFLRIYRLQV